jgi:hypothetical protein
MKIENFYSLEKLYDRIKQDKNSKRISDRRFPIRLIFINSFEELQEIIRFLKDDCGAESKEITELLSSKDQWLTPNEIVNWIKGIYNNAVVTSLSEFLRFQNKENFYITLKKLTEIETQNNIRIYIPLVGLCERFKQEFWTNFYRKEEWAPIWKLESHSQKIIIYQINFELNYENLFLPENFEIVLTTEEWLNVWKKGNMKGILSLSKSLSCFYKNFLPDQVFELREISNQKEFLKDIFEINVPIEFKDDEKEFWNELIKEAVRYNQKGLTIENIFLSHFNLGSAEKLTSEEFLDRYLRTNEHYERWLIRIFLLSLGKFKSSYLYKCFERLGELKEKDLIEKLWLEIFNLPFETLTEDIFSERREFLNFIHKKLNISAQFIERKLDNALDNIKSYPLKKKLKYLTNITFIERRYIISELKNTNINIQEIIPDLKRVYPELAYYLDWDLIKPDNEVDNWILEYFKKYNCSKIRHTKSQKIEELISNKNKDKSTFSNWYYSLPKAEIAKDFKYVWIDGLGAEWFPLIVNLLNKYGKENGKIIKKKMLTRVNLPSITKCNRYEFERIEDLDNHIHNQKSYNYPDDLIKEIELIEEIVKKIMEMPDDRICIVSDHGFSFLCLKDFDNFKRFNFSNAEHEGRYMWIDKIDYKDDEYFIVWNVDEGNCRDRNMCH